MNIYRENRTGKWGGGRLINLNINNNNNNNNNNNKNSDPSALFSS